jgi:hypothetical protein
MRLILLVLTLALSSLASAAGPKDMPARKSGLWEIEMHADAMPQPMVTQQCIDEKTDNLVQQQGEAQARQHCSKNGVRKQGNQVIAESVCQFDSTTATTRAVFSGDFRQNYRGEINTTYSPPIHGMKSSKQTLEAKWLGPCKPGQKPGDIMMPGMSNMNLNDIMKKMPKP